MAHTIELKKVSKYYANEDTVSMGFSRIDLNLDIGEFVAITGESGSGKSTLLNVISGLDTYEEGEMFVCGEDTTAYGTEDYENYRKKYIGNIFQDFNLINSYTVYQNVEAVMLLSGKRKGECRKRILELLDLVGLREYRRTKASRLSGGQKQRVAIARALAKDAPIIVADEPTGNLDTASADIVMQTLSKVSHDKLVVIVTHNYEQAEPYVTRKLTMHDGKIIEDKDLTGRSVRAGSESFDYADDAATLEDAYLGRTEERQGRAERLSPDEAPAASADSTGSGKPDTKPKAANVRNMRKSTELRLGIRNTFNLPAKFLLLFIVYLFVSTAVLGQYAATKNSMHQGDLLGTNPYFTNTSSDRIVVKKSDESAFTEEDIENIRNMPNIRSIILNDLGIDRGICFTIGDFYVEGSIYPVSEVTEDSLTYGHMPENDYEIIVYTDSTSDAYYSISEAGEALIDKTVVLQDMGQMQTYTFDKPIKIAGVIVNDTVSEDSDFSLYGYSTIYASETVSNDLLVSMMASASQTEIDFGGTRIQNENDQSLFTADKIPEGKAYIFEDEAYFYKDAKAVGKDLGVKVSNRFFESEAKFTVEDILTTKNIEQLTGVKKTDYDMFYNAVFISEKDFKKLFDRGYFQISVFMQNEADSEETVTALQEAGLTALVMKDSLTDMTGGFNFVIQMMTYARLLLEFIILFYIAYAVIKLIMRSRNSYFSTLRILGATKKNTDNILRVELLIMMLIAYGVDIGFVYLVRSGRLDIPEVEQLLHFLTPIDYAALAVLLLIMSLLIANRYSRKIFTKSAMKAFREEA